ncbi:MAG: PqqD family peptide modification chaperone [Acidobacteriia bacterium]|nr:PqqD family peptide modification chaperone [Terriglobia bacterium]
MKERVGIEEGLSCFLLEQEGILFSEGQQELYALNTPATYVWCCLEEGMTPGEMGAAFSASFDVPRDQALRTIGDLLSRWQAFGYLRGVPDMARSEIDWTTALGRLMASPALREEFRSSPAAVARKLRVASSDRRAFVSLRPADVELEAQQFEERKRAQPVENVFESGRFVLWSSEAGESGQSILRAALEARARHSGRMNRVRYYRLLTTTFAIRFSSAAEQARVHPTLAHLEIEPARVDVALEVLGTPAGHVLVDGIAPFSFCRDLDRLAPRFKTWLLQTVVRRHSYFLELHAGVVSNGEKCVLLPAAPGSGKTTLTAALAAAGFQYFSDEIALLEEPDLEVRPVPISLSVKSGATDILAPLFPQRRRLARHTREDFESVTYLNPPAASLRYEANRTYPAGWIVFPQYSPGVTTELRPIGKAEALARLVREILVVAKPLDKRTVRSLVEWIQRVECYELPNSSLSQAVELIGRLLKGPHPNS